MAIRQQANYGGHLVSVRRGMHFRTVHFLGLRYTLQQQHHGTSHRSHIYGLVGRVEHQDGLLHQRRTSRHHRIVGSTTGRTFGARHSCGSRIGGMAPPGIARVWPHGAHRAFLGSSSPKPATGLRTARATVSPITDFAPASSSAREQASSVAPVVITSSTSKTRRLSTWVPGGGAKAPRTDSPRSSTLTTRLSGRGRVRISSTAWRGKRSLLARGLASRSAWLYPRSFSRTRCSGTGTTTSARSASRSRSASSASRAANQPPSGSP